MSPPFVPVPFAQIPATPRKPHAFFRTTPIELQLDSKVMGPIRIHVRRFGAGPPLFLVHGLMTSSYSWRYVYEAFGAHYTCYAPDLPANGRSDAPESPRYDALVLARLLLEIQAALDIRGCRVVGNSMGGYLSMLMALEEPAAVARLVNLHSPGLAEPRLWALQTALALPGMQAFLRWLIRRKPLEWAHKNVHYYDESLKSLEEAHEYGDPLASRAGAQGLVKYLKETMAPGPMGDFAARLRALPQFPVPLLLLYAEQDPMVPPKMGERLRALVPSARFEWLKEASHFAHVDNPERFLAPTLAFLREG